MASIVLDSVSYSYPSSPKREILSGLTVTIEAGTFVSVVGPNGCGKSTMLRVLNGLIVPNKGRVCIDGLTSSNRKDILPIRQKVALLFQNPDNAIVGDTVEEDIAFGPENLGLDEDEITNRVNEALAAVGLEDKRFSSPQALSGGEKARLGLAGVLALEPDVLALDEATAMVDPEGRRRIMEILRAQTREKGRTVILVTHHSDETLLSDRIIVMDKGQIVRDGTPREVYSDAEKLLSLGISIPPIVELSASLGLESTPLDEEELALALEEIHA